jgi:endo-1,4-beta-D-glucanase Y
MISFENRQRINLGFSELLIILLLGWGMAACSSATPLMPTSSSTPVLVPINTSTPRMAPMRTSVHTLTPTSALVIGEPLRPFPQHGEYAPGSILPDQRTQQQLDDDVRAFYDYWKATYLIEAGQTTRGDPIYRVAFAKELPDKGTTVSEGQGFGMIIVSLLAGYDPEAQTIFDGLWQFACAHPSMVDERLMDWKVPDTESGNDSAFDGDADMAFGLLLADVQWGSQGEIDYKADATTLITGILESTIGPDSRLPMLGDWVDPAGEVFNQYTPRSSDFMLVNFRAYGKITSDPVWEEVATGSLDVMRSIQQDFSQTTGLMPDFIVMTGSNHIPEPAPADFLEGPEDGDYSYNAGRVPFRVGSDALLNNASTSRDIVQKISGWAETVTQGDPANFRAGYDLQGNPLPDSDHFSTFFVSPLGVAAMTNPGQQSWLNTVYDSVYNQHEDYFEDSVNLLCLLVMTGNFWTS